MPPAPDRTDGLLRAGLSRLAEEPAPYPDPADLRRSVLARASARRTTRRAVALAAVAVPVAALAGYAVGSAPSHTADPVLGTAATGAATTPRPSPRASAASTPRPTPSASAARADRPSSAATRVPRTGPDHSTVPLVRPRATAATSGTGRGATTAPRPAARPVVELVLRQLGRPGGAGHVARYRVSWRGGDAGPVLVSVRVDGRPVDERGTSRACTSRPRSGAVTGTIALPGAGPYVVVATVRTGCGAGATVGAATLRWTWQATASPPLPTTSLPATVTPAPQEEDRVAAPSAPTSTPTSTPAGTPTSMPSGTASASATASAAPDAEVADDPPDHVSWSPAPQ